MFYLKCHILYPHSSNENIICGFDKFPLFYPVPKISIVPLNDASISFIRIIAQNQIPYLLITMGLGPCRAWPGRLSRGAPTRPCETWHARPRQWLHSQSQSSGLWSSIMELFVGRKFIYNLLTFLLTLTLIMGVSIFTYGTFYFAYMPTEVRTMTFIDIPLALQRLHPRSMRKKWIFSSVHVPTLREHAASQTAL